MKEGSHTISTTGDPRSESSTDCLVVQDSSSPTADPVLQTYTPTTPENLIGLPVQARDSVRGDVTSVNTVREANKELQAISESGSEPSADTQYSGAQTPNYLFPNEHSYSNEVNNNSVGSKKYDLGEPTGRMLIDRIQYKLKNSRLGISLSPNKRDLHKLDGLTLGTKYGLACSPHLAVSKNDGGDAYLNITTRVRNDAGDRSAHLLSFNGHELLRESAEIQKGVTIKKHTWNAVHSRKSNFFLDSDLPPDLQKDVLARQAVEMVGDMTEELFVALKDHQTYKNVPFWNPSYDLRRSELIIESLEFAYDVALPEHIDLFADPDLLARWNSVLHTPTNRNLPFDNQPKAPGGGWWVARFREPKGSSLQGIHFLKLYFKPVPELGIKVWRFEVEYKELHFEYPSLSPQALIAEAVHRAEELVQPIVNAPLLDVNALRALLKKYSGQSDAVIDRMVKVLRENNGRVPITEMEGCKGTDWRFLIRSRALKDARWKVCFWLRSSSFELAAQWDRKMIEYGEAHPRRRPGRPKGKVLPKTGWQRLLLQTAASITAVGTWLNRLALGSGP